MENGNGKGLFYGVIGVATLIVAIIGATFAYFTASATNDATVVGTAATVGIDMAVSRVTPNDTQYAVGLIPLDDAKLADAITAGCIATGTDNYTACHIYKVTITNNGNSNLTVTGKATLGGAITNIASTTLTGATGTVGTTTTKGTDLTLIPATGGSNTIATTGSQDYYFIVWLDDTGAAQDTPDAGNGYTGNVTFNAAGGSQVTATFTADA